MAHSTEVVRISKYYIKWPCSELAIRSCAEKEKIAHALTTIILYLESCHHRATYDFYLSPLF